MSPKIPDVYEYITGDYNERRLFYRENGRGMRQFADKPDQSKWGNGDCRKCFMPFTVVPMGLYLRCEKCGWIAGLVNDE